MGPNFLTMKKLLILAILLAGPLVAQTPTKEVRKVISGNAITEDLAIGSGRTLSGAGTFDFSGGTVVLPASISGGGSTYQPLDATLTAIGGLTFDTAGQVAYATAIDTFSTITTTAFGRSLWDDADAAAARTTLGLVIGTNVQAWDADLDDLADGSLTGSKIGTGISATNITTGTLAEARIDIAIARTADLSGSYQPIDSDLTSIAALATSTYGRSVLEFTSADQLKTDLSLVKADVGLGNVDNTSDLAKPVSTATQTALDLKANTDITFIVQVADADLTNEQALGNLATGILKNTTTSGILSIAVAGTDYLAPPASPVAGDLLYYNGSTWTNLGIGTAGQVLTTNAGATAPEWAAASGGGTGTDTLARWTALDNQPPAATFATADTRNAIAVLDFDADADESAVFVGIIPEGADFTTGITVRIVWTATSATTGDVIWATAFERGNTDLDADSFATAITGASATTNATSGIATTTAIDHGAAEIDGLTTGDLFRLKVTRDADNASDTMTGDAEVIAVEIRQR